jgi:hypothetical protein
MIGVRRLALVVPLLLVCSCGLAGPTSGLPVASGSTSTAASSACSGDPHAHVYHPDRLQLLAACVTVAGTIESDTPQADGDEHVRLRLDPGQTCAGQLCLNGGNASGQRGDLLLEPVCQHGPTQEDAIATCSGWQNGMVVPPVGTHVIVSGPWVLDLDHGWNELHPLEAVHGG